MRRLQCQKFIAGLLATCLLIPFVQAQSETAWVETHIGTRSVMGCESALISGGVFDCTLVLESGLEVLFDFERGDYDSLRLFWRTMRDGDRPITVGRYNYTGWQPYSRDFDRDGASDLVIPMREERGDTVTLALLRDAGGRLEHVYDLGSRTRVEKVGGFDSSDGKHVAILQTTREDFPGQVTGNYHLYEEGELWEDAVISTIVDGRVCILSAAIQGETLAAFEAVLGSEPSCE